MASAYRFEGHNGGVSGKAVFPEFFGKEINGTHVVAVDHHNVGGFVKNELVVFFDDFEDGFYNWGFGYKDIANNNVENEYIEGTIVKILGFEVYNNTNPRIEV